MLAARAARQHRVVSAAQLAQMGFDRNAVDYRVRRGRLFVIHRGVYALGRAGLTRHGHAMAAVLACGPTAVASHHLATALHEFLPSWPNEPEITVTTQRRSRAGIYVHTSRSLAPAQTTRRENIPVTSPARTIVDLADVAGERTIERALAEAEALRQLTRSALAAELLRTPGRRGTAIIRELLRKSHLNRTKRELEEAFIVFIDDTGFPRPKTNARVAGYEVDAIWRDQQLIAELDSWQFHGTRDAFERDRVRDAKLQAHGYRIVRITWRRLEQRSELEADLGVLLGYAAAHSSIHAFHRGASRSATAGASSP
jgi:predicted transcriptional regulator of viral defense system